MHMRTPLSSVAILTLALVAACHTAPPPPPAPPPPLSDSAAAALGWVQSHNIPISAGDSTPNASTRGQLVSMLGDARMPRCPSIVQLVAAATSGPLRLSLSNGAS